MIRATIVPFLAVFVVAVQAQEQPSAKDVTDTKEHWLFEFDVSSDKALGALDDIRAIQALCYAEARRDPHSARIGKVPSARTGKLVIHWTSPSQTVTKINYVDGVGAVLFVLEKKDTQWFIVHQYHVAKYP
jgi:hypothetical protein